MKNRRFGFVDVTLRDAHQCLWSTRMTTAMMTPILGAIDRAGYDVINILGGAVFDVCVRYLQENPYERVGLLCSRLETPCDGLTRGQSLYTFELFPDDIVALNAEVLARLGIKIFTVYDALNDNRNIESSVEAGRKSGMKINGWVTYTLSPVHTDAYYVARVKELVKLKVDYMCVKDPTGLLTPERGKTLFPALVKAAGKIPFQLHSHCQSGLAPKVYAVAMQSGFTHGYTATEPLANGASLPATEEIAERARRLGFRVSTDKKALKDIADYFRWISVREDKPMGKVAKYDPALYEHQIPGGMISNLRYQLQTMKLEHRLPEILEEAARVRKDLGYPIVVSPFAQYIVTQSVLNVVQGERYRTIPDEIRKYAAGYYGKLAARPSGEFLDRLNLKKDEIVKERPGEHIEPWIPRLRKELGAVSDEQLLLHAFYDKALVDAIKPLPELSFKAQPLAELVSWIGQRRDIEYAKIRFAGTEMTFSS
jgi:pyruvate/oxaloacetate carboxyltransferase